MYGNNRRAGTSQLDAVRTVRQVGRWDYRGSHYMVRWPSTRGEAGSPAHGGLREGRSAVAQRRGLPVCRACGRTAKAWIARLGSGQAAQEAALSGADAVVLEMNH